MDDEDYDLEYDPNENENSILSEGDDSFDFEPIQEEEKEDEQSNYPKVPLVPSGICRGSSSNSFPVESNRQSSLLKIGSSCWERDDAPN